MEDLKMKPILTIEIPKFTVSFDGAEDQVGKKRSRPETDNGLKHRKPKKAKNAGVHS